jgi:multidrug resistance protein, MATE family
MSRFSITALLLAARRIRPLAWPLLIGQVAVIAFSTIDTALVARYAADDLAALAVGLSTYVTIFVGFMGVVVAIGPVAGQAFGGKRLADAGNAVHQAVWVALALSAVGSLILMFPQPFLTLSQATPDVADKVRGYLAALAFALPAALLFTVYRGFNNAVSRPKAVMALQLLGLALKVPLSLAFIYGFGPVPAMGVVGCGVATAIAMWAQVLGAWWMLRRDPFYEPFALHHRGETLRRPDRPAITRLLKLGVPMGLGIALEVTSFSFMALFISRIGATPVAGHQIASNLAAVMFMVPLSLANACATLVAQRVGAGDLVDARRLGWHGMVIALAMALALGLLMLALRGPIVGLYTNNTIIAAAALPLLVWVAAYHVFDAVQTMAAFVLRSWGIATLPMVIYGLSLWGVGLGGGWWLVFGSQAASMPQWVQGAMGYWVAAVAGLLVAAIALTALLSLGLPKKVKRL